MRIYIDYYLKQDDKTRLMHDTVTEDEIMEYLKQKFYDGDMACPIGFDRETVKVKFEIAKVTV